jgi:pimeloyl-ACP methyl ester carboxylesterase
VPEHQMTSGPAYVERLLRAWAAPGGSWPTPDVARRYADAMALPFVAHSAAEYYRWVVRSQVRPDGRRFVRRVQGRVQVPAMYLQGDCDGALAPSSTRGSAAYVAGPYEEHVLAGAGHFLPEEAPDAVTAHLTRWLDGLG